MDFENILRLNATTEISYVSGVLRVTIQHDVNMFRLLLDILLALWSLWMEVHSWRRGSPLGFGRIFTAIAIFGALGDVTFQLTGSETIEFSPQGLKIQGNFFGWEYTSQYPIEKCSELSWQPEEGRRSHKILEVKVGWRKVSFGKYLSQAQAWEILSELQQYLPDVAQKMGMSPEGRKSHLTSLGLS